MNLYKYGMVLYLFLLQFMFSGDSFECFICIFFKLLHAKFPLGSKLFVFPVITREQLERRKMK